MKTASRQNGKETVNAKRNSLRLILALLLLLAIALPAQALLSKEPPAVPMKPIVREGDLRFLYTEEGGFICPDGLYFGMPLEEAVELLPLSETMRPGEEAFDERKYAESSDGRVTLTPFVYYAYGEIDDILALTVAFNADHQLSACTLANTPLAKVEEMSDDEREADCLRLRTLIETFSAVGEPIVIDGPEDLSALDFAWFENGGQLNAYFPLGNSYGQVSASISMDQFTYAVILGNLADEPAVADMIR